MNEELSILDEFLISSCGEHWEDNLTDNEIAFVRAYATAILVREVLKVWYEKYKVAQDG